MSNQNPFTYARHGCLWEPVSLQSIRKFPVNSKSSWIYTLAGVGLYPADPWLLGMGTHCEVGSKQWGRHSPQRPFPETHTVDPGCYFSNDLLHSGCCSEIGSYLKISGSQTYWLNMGKVNSSFSGNWCFRLQALFWGDHTYFSISKFVCLSSSGQCSDVLPLFFIKHSNAKEGSRETEAEQSGKKFFKKFREGEGTGKTLCWLTSDGKSLNHNRPHLYWHALAEGSSWVKLLSILFWSLAVDRPLFVKQTAMTGFYRSNAEQKCSLFSPRAEVSQWTRAFVRRRCHGGDSCWLSFHNVAPEVVWACNCLVWSDI